MLMSTPVDRFLYLIGARGSVPKGEKVSSGLWLVRTVVGLAMLGLWLFVYVHWIWPAYKH